MKLDGIIQQVTELNILTDSKEKIDFIFERDNLDKNSALYKDLQLIQNMYDYDEDLCDELKLDFSLMQESYPGFEIIGLIPCFKIRIEVLFYYNKGFHIIICNSNGFKSYEKKLIKKQRKQKLEHLNKN
jgi:hypothetical protein